MTGFVVLLTGSDILAASEGLSGVQIVHHAFDINFLTENESPISLFSNSLVSFRASQSRLQTNASALGDITLKSGSGLLLGSYPK